MKKLIFALLWVPTVAFAYPDGTIIEKRPVAVQVGAQIIACDRGAAGNSSCVVPHFVTRVPAYIVTYICNGGTQYCQRYEYND